MENKNYTLISKRVKDENGAITTTAHVVEKEVADQMVKAWIEESKENKVYDTENDRLEDHNFYYNGTLYCEQYTRIDVHNDVFYDPQSEGDVLVLVSAEPIGRRENTIHRAYKAYHKDIKGIVGNYVLDAIEEYNEDVEVKKTDLGYLIKDALYAVWINIY